MSVNLKNINYTTIIGSIVGIVIAVTLLSALLPDLGTTWGYFIDNMTASETWGSYVGLFSVVPIIIVVGILAIFIPKMKNKA